MQASSTSTGTGWGSGRRALAAVMVGVVVCGGAAALIVAGLFGGLGSARSLPRGELVVATLPAKPAAVDRPAVLKQVAAVRTSVKAPALSPSSCLDSVAAGYAATIARVPAAGTTPEPSPVATACGGPVRLGWVRGVDPTGVVQARSVFTRDTAGVSPLADPAAKQVGVAVVAVPGAHKSVSGYVLAWAVSR